ncbi:PP2C family protein-serine/threonine phosphatase [Novosphingobium terrae]|uniref:PP2C family protein-serine/threonine phosphatase n=1 Tax=Novosphingobium terrae TaxID=2726189 RepID=UPI0019815D37|nr:protein phosphatase 2C domain-containing protein [Novosphingobium terrae]
MSETFARPEAQARPACASAARSHVGHVRKINEDRLLDCPERGLWAVADGMGGLHGGDVAAELVIGALRQLVRQPDTITEPMILEALHKANAAILARGHDVGCTIGSTVVVLHLAGDQGTLFWAGDSRAYHRTQGAWVQVTRDHSVVQELVDAGLIDGDQARRHPKAHIITRALGITQEIDIAQETRIVSLGDCILLCSDGLTRMLNAQGFTLDTDIRAAADALLSEALHLDGSDNISLILTERTSG